MLKNKIVGYNYQYTLKDGGKGSTYFPARNLAEALKLIYRLKELKAIESGTLFTDVRLQSDVEYGTQLVLKLAA